MSTISLSLGRTASLAVALAVTLSAGFFASGCSETRSEGTATGLGSLAESIGSTKEQINRTTGSLQKLKTGENLKETYQQFAANVDAVKSSAASVKSHYESMQAQADTYVATWQKEVEAVQDPELKKSAMERSAKVKASVAGITKSLGEAKEAYAPLIVQLDDLKTVLANDVTPEGVKGATPTIDKAIASSIAVQTKLGAVSADMDVLRGKLAPPAPAK